VHLHAAGRAVDYQLPEFPLQVSLDLQEFQPNLLRGDRDGVIGG
jgi:hypothetical protein